VAVRGVLDDAMIRLAPFERAVHEHAMQRILEQVFIHVKSHRLPDTWSSANGIAREYNQYRILFVTMIMSQYTRDTIYQAIKINEDRAWHAPDALEAYIVEETSEKRARRSFESLYSQVPLDALRKTRNPSGKKT